MKGQFASYGRARFGEGLFPYCVGHLSVPRGRGDRPGLRLTAVYISQYDTELMWRVMDAVRDAGLRDSVRECRLEPGGKVVVVFERPRTQKVRVQ